MTSSSSRSGVYAALFSFFAWGMLPIYWKSLQVVPPFEILCHRIIWSLLFVALILTWQKRWRETRAVLTVRNNMGLLLVSGVLIGTNWFLFIWAVNNGHVLETSQGYYITPLVSIVLGRLFCGDQLRPVQVAAIALACFGVGYLIVDYGHIPWVALVLALCFGLYGLVRKKVRVEPLPGVFWETLVLCPVAGWYLLRQEWIGAGAIGTLGPGIDLLLIGAGVVPTILLWAFVFASRNLSLTTLGLLQYIAPSCTFLLGVFLYGEHFSHAQMVVFSCIWGALVLYSGESLVQSRRRF